MGRGGRVDYKALDIGDIGQQREDLQMIDELEGLLLAALNVEGEDRCAAVGEVLLIQGVVGVIGQAGVIDLLHLGVVGQELDDLFGVFIVAVQTQGERLGTLQQHPCVERADAAAQIAQDHGAHIGHKGGRAGSLGKADAVVAGVRLREGGEFAAGLPVELAGVNDDAAQRGAVAADELGGRMDNDVGTMLDRADQVGRAEGVVDDKRNAVLVGDSGNGVNVGDVGVGVAKRFNIDSAGVVLNGSLDLGQIMGVDKGRLHTERGQRVGQQVGGAAVDGFLRHNVPAVLGQCLKGVVDGSGAGGNGQRGNAALQSRDALFKNILGGVGQAAVDVALGPQGKAVSGILGIGEHIGGGLVDGHRTGIGDGIGLLLADVQLKGLKMQFTLAHDKILISVFFCFFVKEKPGVVLVQLPGRICSAAPVLQAVQSIAPRPDCICPGVRHSATAEILTQQITENVSHILCTSLLFCNKPM